MRNIGVLCLALTGCDAINNAVDAVENIFNKRAAVGIVTEVVPDEAVLTMPLPEEFQAALGGTIWVMEVGSGDTVTESGIEGLQVDMVGCSNAGPFEELGDGAYYFLEPGTCVSPRVEIVDGQKEAALDIDMPVVPVLDLPTVHDGSSLSIDWTGQDFHGMLVVVMNAQTGSIVYTNEPETTQDWIDLAIGTQDSPTVVPSSAFPSNGVYAIAVTGYRRVKAKEIDGLNSVATRMLAGKTVVKPLAVGEAPGG